MASRSTVNSIKKNIEQNIIEITNQYGNVVDIIQQTTDLVELVTPGPQGPKGDKGDKGDPGDIGAFTNLIVPGDISGGGDLTIDGDVTATNLIGTSSYATFAENSGLADTATIAVNAINAETASFIQTAEFAKSIPPKPAGLLGVSEPILYTFTRSETQTSPDPGGIVFVEGGPSNAFTPLLVSSQSINNIDLAPQGFGNNFFYGEIDSIFTIKETGSGAFIKGRFSNFSVFEEKDALYIFNLDNSIISGSIPDGAVVELSYDISSRVGISYPPNLLNQSIAYPTYNYLETFQTNNIGNPENVYLDPLEDTGSISLRDDISFVVALTKSADLELNSITASVLGDLEGTSSYSLLALNSISSSHSAFSDQATSSSYSVVADQATSSSYSISASYATTSSYATLSDSSNFASIATQAITANAANAILVAQTNQDNTYGFIFADTNAATPQALYMDSQIDIPSWNPSSNLLLSPNISASSTLFAQTLSLPNIPNVSASIAAKELGGSSTINIENQTISIADPTSLSSVSTLDSNDKLLLWDGSSGNWAYTTPPNFYPIAGSGISVSGKNVAIDSDFIENFSTITSTTIGEDTLVVHTEEGARQITPQNLFAQLPLFTTPQNIEFLEVTASKVSSPLFEGTLLGTSSLSLIALTANTASYIDSSNINQPFTNLSASLLSIDGIQNVSASIAAAASSGGTFEGGFNVDLEIGNITASQAISASQFIGNLLGTSSYATEALSVDANNITQPFPSLTINGAITQSGGDVILLGLKNQTSTQDHVVTYNNTTGRLYITASTAFGGGTSTTITPGGDAGQIQYNNGGVLAGTKTLSYDSTGTSSLSLEGSFSLNQGVLSVNGIDISQSLANTLITASVTNNTILFTKSDSSTFNLTIDTGSTYTDSDTIEVLNSQQVLSGSASDVRTFLNIDDGATNTPNPAISNNSGAPSLTSGITAEEIRSLIGVDPSGTDNSTNVTLNGDYDYITLSGQELVRHQIDLNTDVTGTLQVSEGGTGLTSISSLLNSNVTKTSLGLSNVTNDAQLKLSSNLSDLSNVSTARDNLELGSGDDVTFNTVNATSFTGSLQGTAQTASYVENAQTASYVENAQTASYVENAQTASYVEIAQTASYVENAQTASYVENAQTASYIENAQTASYVETAQTASHLTTTDLSIGGTLSINGIPNVSASIAEAALSGDSGTPFAGGPEVDLELRHLTASNISASGELSIFGISNVSESIALAALSGDNLGNHTASLDLYMGGNSIKEISTITSTANNYNKQITIGNGSDSIDISLDGSNKYRFFPTTFRAIDSTIDLGTSTIPWDNIYGNSLTTTNISASGYISASAFVGDGSQLTGIGGEPFPYTGNAGITGNLSVTGDITSSNISASGYISASSIEINDAYINDDLYLRGGRIIFSRFDIPNDQYIEINPIQGSGNYVRVDGDNYIFLEADSEVRIISNKLGIGPNYTTAQNSHQVPEALTVEGNISASGFINIEGDLAINGISNVSASIAEAALSGGDGIPFTGGSDVDLELRYLTASIVSASSFTGSLQGTAQTASYVENAQTASYVETAQTASYIAPSDIGDDYSAYINSQFNAFGSSITNLSNTLSSLQGDVLSNTANKLNSNQTGSGFNSLTILGDVTLEGLINQTTPQNHVVTFNNQTGQLYITASTAFGGTTTTGNSTPGGPEGSVQFNSAGVLDGSSNLLFVNNELVLTGSILVDGSIVGDLQGTAQTASYVENAQTASYVENAQTASHLTTTDLSIAGILSLPNISNVSASISEAISNSEGTPFTGGSDVDLELRYLTASNISASGYISASSFIGEITASSLSVLGTGIPTIESPTNIILSASNAVVIQSTLQLPGILDVSASIAEAALSGGSGIPFTGGSDVDLELRYLTASIVSASSFTGSLHGTALTASYIAGGDVVGKVLQSNTSDSTLSIAPSNITNNFSSSVSTQLNTLNSSVESLENTISTQGSSIQGNTDSIDVLNADLTTLNSKSLISESVQVILDETTINSVENTRTNLGLGSSDDVTFNTVNATSFTGSLQGTAQTASYVENAQTASYIENAQTASYVETAQTASYVENAQTSSYVETAQTASYIELGNIHVDPEETTDISTFKNLINLGPNSGPTFSSVSATNGYFSLLSGIVSLFATNISASGYVSSSNLSVSGILSLPNIPNVSASIAEAALSGGNGTPLEPYSDLEIRNITASGFISSSDLETGNLTTNGTVQLKDISDTTPQNHILTYDTSTGQVYITASNAFGFGGGGGGTPGGGFNSIQYNDTGVLGGSNNFTIDDDGSVANIKITGSLTATEKIYADDVVLTGTGIPTITSNTNIILSASNAVEVRSPMFRLRPTTTGSAENQGAIAGDIVYDSEQDKFFGKTSVGWVAFH